MVRGKPREQISMKGNSAMGYRMEKELTFGQPGKNIKGNGKMAKGTASGNTLS